MFEQLSEFNLILVTGPQRSGTTITAQMVAADSGLRYVDEREFLATDEDEFDRVLYDYSDAVIQCPGMCHRVDFHGWRDDVLVIMVRRDLDDIMASQRRIAWPWEQFELAHYGDYPQPGEPVASVKYRFFDEHQRGKIENVLDVQYKDLAAHPLWVAKRDRANFHSRQTAVD